MGVVISLICGCSQVVPGENDQGDALAGEDLSHDLASEVSASEDVLALLGDLTLSTETLLSPGTLVSFCFVDIR